jgi:hypothetical protein
MYSGILGSVHDAVFAVDKRTSNEYYIFLCVRACVCVALCIQHAKLYIFICVLLGATSFFFIYLTDNTIYRKIWS